MSDLVLNSVEEFIIRYRIHNIRAQKIKAKAFRWLIRHLNPILKNGNWKSHGGITGQPKAEIWMCLIWIQVLQLIDSQNKTAQPSWPTYYQATSFVMTTQEITPGK